MPFFSIVIPTYNRLSFITATLNSVLEQDDSDFEIVIVDDGSTDDTISFLTEKYGSHPQIKIIRQENKERGAARNTGFSHATGEYAVFFDSDDDMHKNHLSTLRQKIVENNFPDFVATKYQIRKNNKIRNSDLSTLTEGYYDYHLFLNGNPLACNVCVKRNNPRLKLFEEDRRYAVKEDWMFLLQNLRYQKLFLADKATITMNDHEDRSMRSDQKKIIQKTFWSYEWIKSKVELPETDLRTILAHVNYFSAIHSYIDFSRADALGYLWSAIRLNGLNKKYLLLLVKILIGKKLIAKFVS